MCRKSSYLGWRGVFEAQLSSKMVRQDAVLFFFNKKIFFIHRTG